MKKRSQIRKACEGHEEKGRRRKNTFTRVSRCINSDEADRAALQAAEEKAARLAAEERERKIDEERRKIDAEARERAEVAERRWHEALAKVAAMRQCSPREVNDAPRQRGRPRMSEEEKAAAAQIRKLRSQRGDEGATVRRGKPSAELQLKIRAQVLEAA